jgi:hypothetical protein
MSDGTDYAPIALFVYNRPFHTRQTVTSLGKNELAAESDLFIFSDAAKTPQAASAVEEVRRYIAAVSGFRSVSIIQREENYGLARSITAGVTQLVEQRGRVIVLEDDLVTSPQFLGYMNAALERYEHDEEVMQIAGYMFPVTLQPGEDALFLPFISSWGWATWRRAWRHFNRREDGFDRILSDAALMRRFDLNGRYQYTKILKAQRRKKVDSWAIYWYVSVFTRGGLVLFPKKTLVRNVGFDGPGVNCTVSELHQEDLDSEYRVNVFPASIAVSAEAEVVMNGVPRTRLSASAVLARLRGLLPKRRRRR